MDRMNVHVYTWVVTVAVLVGILLFDALVIGRKPHVPSTKECFRHIGVYVSLAILFGIGIWIFSGPKYATEYYAGYLTEYSLSLDNLFIFLIIFEKHRVPRELQAFALKVGILCALVFRGIFIALGAAVIERFAWVFVLFGAWLLKTAYGVFKDFRSKSDESEHVGEDRGLMRWVKNKLPTTDDWEGTRIFVKRDGKIMLTLMFFVILTLEGTDVMFALDSVPAIYGLTREPFIVFTANVFALMGLRQLYFVLGHLLDKLYYLPVGLTVLLSFIAVKLILHAAHHYGLDARLGFNGEISIGVSLAAIVVIMGATAIASVIKSRRMAAETAAAAEAPELEVDATESET